MTEELLGIGGLPFRLTGSMPSYDGNTSARFGRAMTRLLYYILKSFLHTLDVGDRHGTRGPMSEHPGGDVLNNFLHF